MLLCVTLPGEPRTKKAHNRIIGMGKPCRACGKKPIQRVLPSEQFEEWFKSVLAYGPIIRAELARAGVLLPVAEPVEVRALIYREANRGDLCGFQQAVGDALQSQLYGCQRCNTRSLTPCCPAATVKRDGLGIITDDKLIVSWDGSRLLIDRQCPRVELEIRVLGEPQASLFEERAGVAG